MAALSTVNPTLLDLARRLDPDGKISKIIEILNQTNEILDDMSWKEGNLITGNMSTIRTGLPSATWRKMYQGVQPSKSTTAQVTDTCGMLEAFAEVDAALVELNGNSAEWRLSEEKPFLETFNQEIARTLFFGNEATESEKFTGFAPRYNALSGFAAAENVINGGSAGGQTDNNSIWLVVWGDETVHGIVPKGSKAGFQQEDMGKVVIENADGSNGRMLAYRSHYRWDAGLTVKDWRFVVRIANIDKSTLTADLSTGANLPDLMFQAMRRVPSLSMGRPAFYMSRDMLTKLSQQTSNGVKNSTLVAEDVGGKLVEKFHKIPVRRVDVLAADETRLS